MMGNNKQDSKENKSEKSASSSTVILKEYKQTIEHFISLKGGIGSLDSKALKKKFKEEEKTGEQWENILIELTIIKEVDEKFLSRKIS